MSNDLSKVGELIVADIDTAIVHNHAHSYQWRIGAANIGRKCAREIFYTFRWVRKNTLPARMIRLYARGHLEELRFNTWLTQIDGTVYAEKDNGKPFLFSFCDGHLGGKLDAVVVGLPHLPEGTVCIAEYKTHNDKNFKGIEKKGVEDSKYAHFVQTQLYLKGYDIEHSLYLAINKNTDELYAEVIQYDEVTADRYIDRASGIIATSEPPPKLSEKPSWFECKTCTFHGVCHKDDIPDINCRTCAHSSPIKDGSWSCTYTDQEFTRRGEYQERIVLGGHGNSMAEGCDKHLFNPHLIGAKVIRAEEKTSSLVVSLPDGQVARMGYSYLTSKDLAYLNKEPENIVYLLHETNGAYSLTTEVGFRSLPNLSSWQVLSREEWIKGASGL